MAEPLSLEQARDQLNTAADALVAAMEGFHAAGGDVMGELMGLMQRLGPAAGGMGLPFPT